MVQQSIENMLSRIADRGKVLALLLVMLPNAGSSAHAIDDDTVSGKLDGILLERLDEYRAFYPEIMFVNMKGGEDLVANMMTLDILLGHEPESLDYEHTPELREDLMLVTAGRILDMLRYTAPSATLLRADDPLGWQETICALTINPTTVGADSREATKHLLGMPNELVQRIPVDMHLAVSDYLVFITDHEIYHCLQSLYVGPQSMSDQVLWGEYHHYLNELGADAYALMMHIRDKSAVTPFVRNVQRIRGTALSTEDPNHLTCKAAEKVLQMPVDEIKMMDPKQVFEAAVAIREQLTIDYQSYVAYLAAAVAAMQELGVSADISDEIAGEIRNIKPDPSHVKTLIDNTRRCLTDLGQPGSM
jgi:hypothetical protein